MSEQRVNHRFDNEGKYLVPGEGEPLSNIFEKGSLSDMRKAEATYAGGQEVNKGNDLGMGANMGTNKKGRNGLREL